MTSEVQDRGLVDGFRVVSFSCMATSGHQRGTGVGRNPAAAPWSRRREIVTRYLLSGGFDFIGLQHCHYARGAERCAVSYFNSALNCAQRRYGMSFSVVPRPDKDPETGDSLVTFHDQDHWEVDTDRTTAVPLTTVPPVDQDGGGGTVAHFGVYYRRADVDPLRPSEIHVYTIRLRNRESVALDVYRALCLSEILAHRATHRRPDVPAIFLCDTNCKDADSVTDRLLRGLSASLHGLELTPQVKLQDSLLVLQPEAHGRIRTQHNFVEPGEIAGKQRNDRVLFDGRLEVLDAGLSTYNEDGAWPSYHYPVEAAFGIDDEKS